MKDVKSTFFSLFVATLTSLTIWLSIAMTIDPYKTDLITRAAFFASLFLSLAGILSFIIIYISSILHEKPVSSIISSALIQSGAISASFVALLILQSLKVLSWLEFSIIVILFILFELFLKAKNRSNQI